MSQAHALIIDDNIKNVNVLVLLLSEQNIDTTHVTNMLQLDNTLEHIVPTDVVFLDLEMPDIDGYDVLAKLRADTRFRDTPIVAYTVHVSEIDVAHRRGFDGFLGKPLDPDKFPDQLARILNGTPVWEVP
jgi:two-component system cell cycle response regulator DivK